MSLKFRYATALLAVFVGLCGAAWLALIFLNNKQYLLLGVLAVALYGVMFFCGRKMAKVFYLLSLLKFLKKEGGSATKDACKRFLQTALPKKSGEEIEGLLGNVVSQLQKNELVVADKGMITLISV